MAEDPRVARLRDFFETLSPAALGRLGDIYAPTARFKDPFNDVTGTGAIRGIFEAMYDRVNTPRFLITRSVCEGDDAFLSWEFVFCWKSGESEQQIIHGATHIQFAADGRVAVHRDYWDAAEELYEKLPVLGSLMRWLKRRARH
jgi:steroid delta-isomerase